MGIASALVTAAVAALRAVASALSWWHVPALFVVYAAGRLVYNRWFHPLAHIPGPFWYSSTLYAMLFDNLQHVVPYRLLELHEQYGPVVRFAPNSVNIADAAAMRAIYSTHAFPKFDMYRSFDLGHEHTFSTTDIELSKKRKRMLGPMFGALNVQQLEPLIHATGPQTTVDRLNRQHAAQVHARGDKHAAAVAVDLYNVFFEMQFNVLGRLAFGEAYIGADDEVGKLEIVQLIKKMDRGLSFQFVFPKWMHGFLRDVVGFQPLVDIKRAAEFASERLVDRRRHMEALARGEKVDAIVNDNLQMLIDAVDPETGSRLTHDETVAEELVIMFAGTDTSANTMTWTVDLLFQHPEVFARLEAEILAAFPDPDERITYKAAKELLPYLDAVLLESMRLRTVAAAPLSRVVPSGGRDLAGYFFPADTVISASLHVMHNYSALWDEPSRFWPERFLDGPAEVVAERRQQVMPFSIGVRSCIGRQLALVEVVVGLATMIQQFEIRPAQEPYQPLEMHSVFVASPKSKSLMASIRPRRL